MNDEIQHLIDELKQLQLQQQQVLTRLERARARESERITQSPQTRTREFAVGDRVRILNPRHLQANHGVITKIGLSRITIKPHTRGVEIIWAHKNIAFDDE